MSIVPGSEALLTPADVARLARVCAKTVYRAIKRGDLVASRLGSVYRIRTQDFDAWVHQSRHTPAVPTPSMFRRERLAGAGAGTDEALRHIEGEAA
jgi:excisionase family DNA binding protein